MNLTIISDTHCRHEDFGKLEGDVLIHCGDMTSIFLKNPAMQIEDLNNWFGTLSFNKIFCVAGNHDFILQQLPVVRKMFTNATYLEDEICEYNGIKFYGSPWQLTCGNLGFNADEDVLESKWNAIPDDVDVLITHSPPYKILDHTFYGDYIGSKTLTERVAKIAPKVHCFGHCHYSRGSVKIGNTVYVNASNYFSSDKRLKGSYHITIEK